MSAQANQQAADGRVSVPGDLEVHIVPNAWDGNRVARCGFDCSGRKAKPSATPTCVVCVELKRAENELS